MNGEYLIIECSDYDGARRGLRSVRIHSRDDCKTRTIPCCIHNPSQHSMVTWPYHWRDATSSMERICPHDITHPDPDHVAYIRSIMGYVEPHNKCDGCCTF